ncbi:MAG: histone deacetylase family protein [Pirellulaceae bacterium]
MITIYSEDHYLHQPAGELHDGQLGPLYECPQRVESVLDRIRETALGEIVSADEFGEAPITRIHDADFVNFLKTCWEDAAADGISNQILPTAWPARRHRQSAPDTVIGKAGYYAHSVDSAIVEGTWSAARASAMCALTGAKLLKDGQRSAFALCRPPGHHAARDLYGGYCFLNNAAIAAQYLLDQGAQRIVLLDVDFHHGNGTQDIFYERSDVLFVSLHGDPRQAYPYFMGYADEQGVGDGTGFNINYPLPPGTGYGLWLEALSDALERITSFTPDSLVVSLGVDTFEHDPISSFRLSSDDFRHYGHLLGEQRLPTLFVMEGGYAVDQVGLNTINVLQGFLDA